MNKKKKTKFLNKLNGFLRRTKIPFYLHKMGPKKFTSWKLIKLFLLREKFKMSYRDIADFCELVGIKDIHFTTLQKFVQRIPQGLWELLQTFSVKLESVDLVAIDSTGISKTNASKHFLWRIHRKDPEKQALKLSILTDCETNCILSTRIRSHFFESHDIKDVMPLLRKNKVKFKEFRGDMAYDADWLRMFLKERNIRTLIPLRKNSSKKRLRMFDFEVKKYAKGSNVESTFSSFKRKYGDNVNSKKFRMQKAQILCRTILHNLDRIFISFILDFFYWA